MGLYHIAKPKHAADLKRLHKAEAVAVAIKLAGDSEGFPYRSKPVLIQLASAEDTFVLDPSGLDAGAALAELLESTAVRKVFRRAKGPVKQFLHHYGKATQSIFCCHLACQLLGMGNRLHKKDIAGKVQPIRDRILEIDQSGIDPRGLQDGADLQLAAEEARLVFQLYETIAPLLSQHKLKRVSSLEFRTVLPVAAMELRGIYADQQRLNEVKAQIEAEMAAIQSELLKELRGPQSLPGVEVLNLNSPEQVRQALNERGIEVQDTAESRLRPFAAEYPFIGQLLEFRRMSRLHMAVTSQLAEFIMPETGRIHATYHQIASPSGRFACTNPNIQQIPRERSVRGCLCPEPGNIYVIADYSQVELRVAAGLSKDPLMLKAYGEGGDLHRLTAAITMGKAPEKVTKGERQAAKAINFGLIYAMGPKGLQQSAQNSYGVTMSLEEAKTFRQRYFENYRGIQQWQQGLEKFGRQNEYVRTAAGRIRAYAGEKMRITELFNTPVQGTAAEGLKSALCIFWDKSRDAELEASIVAIIHDEIIVEVRRDQAERAKQILESSMIEGIQWLVPNVAFEVDAAIASSWAEK